jgi:hypothetical protein
MELTTLQYLTHATMGCCTTSELMALSREDREKGTKNVDKLKEWAREEMTIKGIAIK